MNARVLTILKLAGAAVALVALTAFVTGAVVRAQAPLPQALAAANTIASGSPNVTTLCATGDAMYQATLDGEVQKVIDGNFEIDEPTIDVRAINVANRYAERIEVTVTSPSRSKPLYIDNLYTIQQLPTTVPNAIPGFQLIFWVTPSYVSEVEIRELINAEDTVLEICVTDGQPR